MRERKLRSAAESLARLKGSAVEGGDYLDCVWVRDLVRWAADGQCGDFYFGAIEEAEKRRKKIRSEGWLVPLDVDVDVGVDVAGDFPDPVGAAGAIGRGHDYWDATLAADSRHFLRVGGYHHRVHEGACGGGAPHPLHHGAAGDRAQDFAAQPRGVQTRRNDAGDSQRTHGGESTAAEGCGSSPAIHTLEVSGRRSDSATKFFI